MPWYKTTLRRRNATVRIEALVWALRSGLVSCFSFWSSLSYNSFHFTLWLIAERMPQMVFGVTQHRSPEEGNIRRDLRASHVLTGRTQGCSRRMWIKLFIFHLRLWQKKWTEPFIWGVNVLDSSQQLPEKGSQQTAIPQVSTRGCRMFSQLFLHL